MVGQRTMRTWRRTLESHYGFAMRAATDDEVATLIALRREMVRTSAHMDYLQQQLAALQREQSKRLDVVGAVVLAVRDRDREACR